MLRAREMAPRDATEVVMPQLGESIVEATLARWRIAPGEHVDRGQIVAEVETDKATNEIPAPAAGVIGELVVPEGVTVKIGTVILRYAAADLPAAAASAPVSGRLPTQHLAPRPLGADGSPRAASPAVRRLARAHVIDLGRVPGTGRAGRITRADVLSFLDVPVAPAEAATPLARASQIAPGASAQAPEARGARGVYHPPVHQPEPGDRRVPFSRRRAYIAEHLVHSIGTAAHVAAVAEVDMGAVLRALATDRPAAERAGVRLTMMAYVTAAVARALAEHPELNATVVEDAVILRAARNLGIAVDTPEGLIVPVVRRADELGVLGLARTIERLSHRAREGTLKADDLAGGTFTISNPGRDGNLFGVSIIRQPEVGILRIGTIVKRPVVREVDGTDVIAIRPIMYAALSYDHRVIDGRTGNAFLHRVVALLESTRPQTVD